MRGKRRILKCRIPRVTSPALMPIFSVANVLVEACSTGNSEENKMRKTLRDRAIDLIRSAVWLSLLCVLGMASGVLAQGVSGRIVGSATDSSGAAIANASVAVTDQDNGVSTSVVTDARGEYRANNLPPGNYQVKVEASSLQTVISKGNMVTVDNATVVYSRCGSALLPSPSR
jgi:hypothetical protein